MVRTSAGQQMTDGKKRRAGALRNRFNFRDSNLRIFLTAVLVMTYIMIYSIGTGLFRESVP